MSTHYSLRVTTRRGKAGQATCYSGLVWPLCSTDGTFSAWWLMLLLLCNLQEVPVGAKRRKPSHVKQVNDGIHAAMMQLLAATSFLAVSAQVPCVQPAVLL